MGIIITDTITFPNGITLANTYCSISKDIINIRKDKRYPSTDPNIIYKKYSMASTYTIWASKDARVNNLTPLDKGVVTLYLDSNELENDVNIFNMIYNEIKNIYPNHNDDI